MVKSYKKKKVSYKKRGGDAEAEAEKKLIEEKAISETKQIEAEAPPPAAGAPVVAVTEAPVAAVTEAPVVAATPLVPPNTTDSKIGGYRKTKRRNSKKKNKRRKSKMRK